MMLVLLDVYVGDRSEVEAQRLDASVMCDK